MPLSATLWDANLDLAQICLELPFLRGIGDGSLSRPRFAYYIGQDAFYLQAFARAYAVAAAKAPDWIGYRALHELAGDALQEMQLHQGVAENFEIDLARIAPGGATRRYADFLLATAWSQETGLTLAAMTPCMRLYAWLGQQLTGRQQSAHAYSGWIATYGGDGFERAAARLERLLDRYTPDTPAAADAYRYAMQCERDFFQAAWRAA
ncbi:MAG: TenA family protein [Candidatus Competibacter sp.]|nr:TenA family protein [Candidatus Competibacter sp.]